MHLYQNLLRLKECLPFVTEPAGTGLRACGRRRHPLRSAPWHCSLDRPRPGGDLRVLRPAAQNRVGLPARRDFCGNCADGSAGIGRSCASKLQRTVSCFKLAISDAAFRGGRRCDFPAAPVVQSRGEVASAVHPRVLSVSGSNVAASGRRCGLPRTIPVPQNGGFCPDLACGCPQSVSATTHETAIPAPLRPGRISKKCKYGCALSRRSEISHRRTSGGSAAILAAAAGILPDGLLLISLSPAGCRRVRAGSRTLPPEIRRSGGV